MDPMILFSIFKSILQAAKAGQTLPILTVILVLHIPLHILFFSRESTFKIADYHLLSILVLLINLILNIVGYILLTKLHQHSIRTIFNRKIPSRLSDQLPSWSLHLSLLKPLEILFRYLTSSFRVLPDVIVLGEVRCGTTTICHHLSNLPGCHTPFCLWKHPELDHKESFYFVGHYFQHVSPEHYRMCFPLKITKWWCSFLKKPFWTFDGCAQYLSSPTAPYLIAEAYRTANQPPPILIACVRNPVDQTMSWWKYENHAMIWGESINLTEWNTDLRTECYPPKSIREALQFSQSKYVSKLYQDAEIWIKNKLCTMPFDSKGIPMQMKRSTPESNIYLPTWAMTWPGGQLSGIGRSAQFSSNILRYESVFSSTFAPPCLHPPSSHFSNKGIKQPPSKSKLKYVNVIPIEQLSTSTTLHSILSKLVHQLSMRYPPLGTIFEQNYGNEKILNHLTKSKTIIHRNASSNIHQNKLIAKPTDEEIHILDSLFHTEIIKLQELCEYDIGW